MKLFTTLELEIRDFETEETDVTKQKLTEKASDAIIDIVSDLRSWMQAGYEMQLKITNLPRWDAEEG